MHDPTSTPHPLSPLNPLSGIPEGSIDSIDRGCPRARSTRSIVDHLGLDRLERLESIDRGSPRARSTRSGIPWGGSLRARSNRLDRSGIPEGSIDSIDRGSLRARSTRTDRSGIPEASINSIDRGSLRGDPLGLDRIDSIDRGSPRARPGWCKKPIL